MGSELGFDSAVTSVTQTPERSYCMDPLGVLAVLKGVLTVLGRYYWVQGVS
jgi:hypothetical protein